MTWPWQWSPHVSEGERKARYRFGTGLVGPWPKLVLGLKASLRPFYIFFPFLLFLFLFSLFFLNFCILASI
jgi:hypothetical protein